MLLRVVLLITFFTVSSFAFLKKCCPESEIIQSRVFESSTKQPKREFVCVTETVIGRYHESHENVFSSHSSNNMIRYNVLFDDISHWPTCNNNSYLTSSVLKETRKVSQSASCVDMMNGGFYIFTCDDSLEVVSDSIKVHNLKKCCNENFSYDVFTSQCVDNNRSSVNKDFSELLAERTIVFQSGIPDCDPDEVLVEYHSLVHKLEINDSSLLVTTANSLGSPDTSNHKSFCIEATKNSVTSLPDGADPEHFRLKQSSKFIAKVCRHKTICNQIPCVRKCCKEGQRLGYSDKMFCENHDTHLQMQFYDFNITASHYEPNSMEPTEYGIMMPKYCRRLHLEQEGNDIHFHSGIDGSIFVPATELFYSNEEYCVDFFYYKDSFDPTVDTLKVETLVCDNQKLKEIALGQKIQATLLAISAIFLGITFFVYVFLPQLLNLHGKTLVCHVLSLFVAYVFLSLVKFSTDEKLRYCKLYAYIMFFSFLAAFSWLNVMCFDIFWTIGSMRLPSETGRARDMKRFIYFSLYAWGIPSLGTLITYTFDNTEWIPETFRPNLGMTSCFFNNSSAGHLTFFLIPIGLQTIANVVFFIITAVCCNRIKLNIHRMQMNDIGRERRRLYIADKAIFSMNLKLFTVMGISWLMEIIAPFINVDTIWWILMDSCNLLQGVFIFIIFVCKRKVLEAMKVKLGSVVSTDPFSLTELLEFTRRRSSQPLTSTILKPNVN